MEKKKILGSLLLLAFLGNTKGQVGINTTTPKVTLDVNGLANDTNSFDGILPPRIKGNDLALKTYTADHDGTVVYVTEAATGSYLAGQTVNVNLPGPYFFDKGSMSWFYLSSNPIITNYASTIAQILDVNSTAEQTITFSDSTDKVMSNAAVYNESDNTFRILYDGYYQISGFIGFNANRSDFTSLNQYVAVNLKFNCITSGSTLTGIRTVFIGIAAATGTAIQIPPTFVKLKANDKINFTIQRPSLFIGTSAYPNQTLGAFSAPNGHINKPNGQTFTKTVTIMKIK